MLLGKPQKMSQKKKVKNWSIFFLGKTPFLKPIFTFFFKKIEVGKSTAKIGQKKRGVKHNLPKKWVKKGYFFGPKLHF